MENLRLALTPMDIGERERRDAFNLKVSIFIYNYRNSLYGGFGTYYVTGIVHNALHILTHFTLRTPVRSRC